MGKNVLIWRNNEICRVAWKNTLFLQIKVWFSGRWCASDLAKKKVQIARWKRPAKNKCFPRTFVKLGRYVVRFSPTLIYSRHENRFIIVNIGKKTMVHDEKYHYRGGNTKKIRFWTRFSWLQFSVVEWRRLLDFPWQFIIFDNIPPRLKCQSHWCSDRIPLGMVFFHRY